MNEKREIMILLPCYLPGYKAGGPIRSISNLVALLGNEFRFKLLAMDRDRNDSAPYPGIAVGAWLRVGNADVMYLPCGPRGWWRLFQVLRRTTYDLLYLNSFFERRFSMFPLLLHRLHAIRQTPLLLAPRGEFSVGALNIKRWRKRLFIRAVSLLKLYRGICWHASSAFEAEDISREMLPGTLSSATRIAPPLGPTTLQPVPPVPRVLIALDLNAPPKANAPVDRKREKPAGTLKIIFLSRISRKKNLHGALMLLQAIRGKVEFHIFGPTPDPAYWEECQRMIGGLSHNIRVNYGGTVPNEQVPQRLADHDLLLLPTYGENYGHIILESMVAGCPVLISDQTPWRDLEKAEAGWDIPLEEPDRFRTVLQQCVEAVPEEYATLCRRTAEFGRARASDPAIVEANRRLFLPPFSGYQADKPAEEVPSDTNTCAAG